MLHFRHRSTSGRTAHLWLVWALGVGVSVVLIVNLGKLSRIVRWMGAGQQAMGASPENADKSAKGHLGKPSPSIAVQNDDRRAQPISSQEILRRGTRPDETETIVTTLSLLAGCPLAEIQRWTQRGEMWAIHGQVVSIEPMKTSPQLAAKLGLKQYFRCTLVVDTKKHQNVIFTANVPRAWRQGGVMGQRAAASCLSLNVVAGDPSKRIPVLVSPRLAWHPETPLGDLGIDGGLLDDVTDRQPLTDADREVFYQMLAAARRAQPDELLRQADEQFKRNGPQRFSLVPLFNDPASHRGRLFRLSGRASRVTRIDVNDPDIIARLGLEHYYEIDLFTADSQDNPIVVCVPSLPDGMPLGGPPEYRESVEIIGFFLKVWRYPVPPGKSDATPGQGTVMQSAPLLVGLPPLWQHPTPSRSRSLTGTVAGLTLALVMAGVWLLLWHIRNTDEEFHENMISGRRKL